jgi:hypothetical protein
VTKDQRQRITAHGRELLKLFPDATETDPVKLCKRLRRIEAAAHQIGMRLCNDSGYSGEEADDAALGVRRLLAKLLGNSGPPVILNRDPRGYALKIDSEEMKRFADSRLHTDWGGYGILAPEID